MRSFLSKYSLTSSHKNLWLEAFLCEGNPNLEKFIFGNSVVFRMSGCSRSEWVVISGFEDVEVGPHSEHPKTYPAPKGNSLVSFD